MKISRFRNIIREQLSMYPDMLLGDMYKLVYQGVMGSGHAVASKEHAGNWLREEVDSLSGFSEREKLFEEISPDGTVLRINLRPFVEGGGDTDRLLTAFIRTGREYRGSNEELVYWWGLLPGLQSKFDKDELSGYIEARRMEYFPAVHHSEEYRKLYKPCYRVALKGICRELGVIE